MKTLQPKCPECEKLSAVREKSQPLGEFLDWLERERGLTLAEFEEHAEHYFPARIGTERLLAEYFNIDLGAAERERSALLKWLQEEQE